MPDDIEYEYGVFVTGYPDEKPHRAGFNTEQAAREWVAHLEAYAVPKGAFYVLRRPVAPWEPLPPPTE